MERKNEELYKKIEEVEALKTTFRPKLKLGNYSAPLTNDFNPRYGIIDIHKIHINEDQERYAIRIMLHKQIPVSMYLLLSSICQVLSIATTIELISVDKEKNCILEVVEKWTSGHIESKSEHPIGRGIIGKYMKENYMSINEILYQMDTNIEVLMAPKDMIELEDMYHLYLSSKEFMEQNGMDNAKEYADALSLVKSCEFDIERTKSLINKPINVNSIYFKIYDPSQLEKFKLREIQITERKTEIWGA
jgi:hypothetical protein